MAGHGKNAGDDGIKRLSPLILLQRRIKAVQRIKNKIMLFTKRTRTHVLFPARAAEDILRMCVCAFTYEGLFLFFFLYSVSVSYSYSVSYSVSIYIYISIRLHTRLHSFTHPFTHPYPLRTRKKARPLTENLQEVL